MILVIGGAGYIGSHFVEELVKEQEVLVLDNFSTGHSSLVNKKARLIKGDAGDEKLLDIVFSENKIKAVVHFAASSIVGESVVNPIKYYENNVCSTLSLLKIMLKHNVKKFIFSSTAATYGITDMDFITEETRSAPINPYGRSKLMIEWMLQDFSKSNGMHYVILRYFNAAGAHCNGEIGENHNPETHLIPIVLQHLAGSRETIHVYGNDYQTKDGTCIRDYVHVSDIASAHLLSLQAMLKNEITAEIFNLGNGAGYSVMNIIRMCEKVTGKRASITWALRREGDPVRLVASAGKIERLLGWKPKYDLPEIVCTAWNWHTKSINRSSGSNTKVLG